MKHLSWAELTCSLYTPTMQNLHRAKLSRHHLHHAPFTRSTDAVRCPDHEAFHPRGTYTMHNAHAAITPRSICTQHFHTALVPWCREGSRGDASLLAVGRQHRGRVPEEPVLPAAPSPTSPGDRGLSVTVDTGWERGCLMPL